MGSKGEVNYRSQTRSSTDFIIILQGNTRGMNKIGNFLKT